MRPLLLPLLLAACSSPSLTFQGTEPTSVTVEGWEMDVYATAETAQAIRLNTIWGATSAEMTLHGLRAVREATGCEPEADTASADPSVLTVEIDCP